MWSNYNRHILGTSSLIFLVRDSKIAKQMTLPTKKTPIQEGTWDKMIHGQEQKGTFTYFSWPFSPD